MAQDDPSALAMQGRAMAPGAALEARHGVYAAARTSIDPDGQPDAGRLVAHCRQPIPAVP